MKKCDCNSCGSCQLDNLWKFVPLVDDLIAWDNCEHSDFLGDYVADVLVPKFRKAMDKFRGKK